MGGVRSGLKSKISRYKEYFGFSWKIFKTRDKYDVIVAWQQFFGLLFCFYSHIFEVRKQNTVVALNFTYKRKRGLAGKIYHWMMNQCLDTNYLDYIHVTSNEYAASIVQEFNFPLDRIIVCSFGIDDDYANYKECNAPEGFKKNQYVLSIGRSNRDFDFLAECWNRIDYPLVIISDSYNPRVKPSKNIHLITNVAGEDSYPWLANSKLMIIPIQDEKICSGDTVLLRGFSYEKTIVVTKPSALSETYIKDGVNGYSVNKNKEDFCALINSLLNKELNDTGPEARKIYLNKYTREAMGQYIANFIFK